MIKTQFLSLLAIAILACTGCKQTNQSPMCKTLDIPIGKPTPNASIMNIASQIDYIALETNDSVLIHEIVGLTKDEHAYYLSDGRALYRFSKEGKLTGKIDKQGNGPDEYIHITDFQIAQEGDVWLLCRGQKQIKKYSWNGELLQTIPLEHWIEKFFLQGNLMYLYGGNETGDGNAYKIQVLDYSTNEVVSRSLPVNEYQSGYLHIMLQQCFAQVGEKLCFYQTFNDTVYHLSQEGATPYLYANLDNKNIPSDVYNQKYANIMEFFQKIMGGSYAYGMPFFCESSSSYFFSFVYNQQQYLVSYPKGSESDIWMSAQCVVGDYILPDFVIDFTESSLYSQPDGSMLMLLSPAQVMEYAAENQQADALKALHISDAEQNPLIMDIKFK